jgi:hypothetical protein
MGLFNVQKITTTNKTAVSFGNNNGSMIFTNNHATDAVTIDLYATSQLGSDITTTGVYAAETEVASSSSVTLTIDNGSGSASAGTSDMLLDERVYKSDGNLFGVCSTFTSTVAIIFATGLANAITDNDILYTGTRYYFLNNVKIPNGTSLKLTADEFSMDLTKYNMYINTDSSTGGIDITTRRAL